MLKDIRKLIIKYSFDYVKNIFSQRGYVLLTKENEYKNVTQKLKYICLKHEDKGILEISFSKLMCGRGCKYCGHERTAKSKTKEINIEECKSLCSKHNFSFIKAEKENGKVFIYFICNKHKIFGVQKMTKNNMSRNIKGCKYCKGDLPEWFVRKKIQSEYPHIQIVGAYKNMTTPVKCKCLKHNVLWDITPQSILNGTSCYQCGLEKLSKHRLYTQEQFVSIIQKVNPDVEIISEYTGIKNDILVKCKKCGYIWSLNANSLKVNGTRCRKCSYTYKGEDKIISVLNSIGCKYIHQYKFDDCRDKRPLPFDFYLPDYNMCIEFDGQQHYEPRFGNDKFEITKYHDKIKNDYCRNRNIDLLRIPYWDSSNIDKIIKEKLHINKTN